MKIRNESIAIVIVGNWNVYIFSPEWVGKEIFSEENFKIDVAMNRGLPNRYVSVTKKVMLIPTESNVAVKSLETTHDCLESAEIIASRLISILPVTPIKAFGINYGYIEDDNPNLSSIFELPDAKNLQVAGYKEEGCTIQRSIKGANCILNVRTTRMPKGASFDFNFHYDVSNANDALSRLKGAVVANKEIAESFLGEVYGLELVEVRG